MLNSTHTLVSPTPTTLEGYLLEFESSMSVSFVSEYSRKSIYRDITKQPDLQPLTVNLTLCMGTSVLCMAHPLMKPYVTEF